MTEMYLLQNIPSELPVVTEIIPLKPYAVCGGKNRQGMPCQQSAGWSTIHPGLGRCKLHGGRAPLGVSSDILKTLLADKIEQYRNDPDLMNLGSSIALMRAVRDFFITGDGKEIPPDYEKAMTAMERERALVKTANELIYGKKFTVTIDQVTDILRQIVTAIKEELHGYPVLQQRLAERIRLIQSSTGSLEPTVTVVEG